MARKSGPAAMMMPKGRLGVALPAVLAAMAPCWAGARPSLARPFATGNSGVGSVGGGDVGGGGGGNGGGGGVGPRPLIAVVGPPSVIALAPTSLDVDIFTVGSTDAEIEGQRDQLAKATGLLWIPTPGSPSAPSAEMVMIFDKVRRRLFSLD